MKNIDDAHGTQGDFQIQFNANDIP